VAKGRLASSRSLGVAAKTGAVVAPPASRENRVTSTIARIVSALRSVPRRALSGARDLRGGLTRSGAPDRQYLGDLYHVEGRTLAEIVPGDEEGQRVRCPLGPP